MIIPVLLFILGLAFLIKGGDLFVDGSVGVAHKFGVPELIIGATVVSIGTTLPEVMVSASSALGGHGEIAYGNAIGSIICNTSLIAALTIAIKPPRLDPKTLRVPVFFFFVSAVIYSAVAYTVGRFDRLVGIAFLLLFAAYMILTVRRARSQPEPDVCGQDEADEPDEKGGEAPHRTAVDVIQLVAGAVLIAVGADLLVDNGIIIAGALGVPESVIALTFVALGTSLPELVTAVTSLLKGHGSLSLGNIIGANFFNLVLVSGVSTVLSPFAVPESRTVFGVNASLAVDIPVMLIVMAVLSLPALIRGRLTRAQGIGLLAVYAAFSVFQFFG